MAARHLQRMPEHLRSAHDQWLPYTPWSRITSGASRVTRARVVAWATRTLVDRRSLRSGMSLFVGADTALGPLYLGLTHAPRGGSGLALFIGRP